MVDEQLRASLEESRLRLDSPLFHRDPGMSVGHAPQLRELTWEHVVRPSQVDGADESDTASVRPIAHTTLSIESLLENARMSSEQPLGESTTVMASATAADFSTTTRPIAEPPSPSPRYSLYADEQDDLAVEVVVAPVEVVPLVEEVVAPVEVAPPVEVVPPVVQRAVADVAVESSVEAELNRLAFLPDMDEETGPVVVPVIAYSEQRAEPAVPSLSHHEMYTARSSAPPASARPHPAMTATAFVPIAPGKPKKKKHFFARFLTFVVVLGLIGGGLFAAKYYLLDKQWEGDVKVFASDVELARGLSFDHAITVTTLPVAEYAAKLVSTSVGITEANTVATAGEWRALGLLHGELDLDAIGMAALPDSPAFYDPASETIYVAAAIPAELYRFAMHRALTLALLDQQFGWSARVKDASPSVALGTKAYYDADALAIASSLTEAASRTEVIGQVIGLYSSYQIAVSPSAYASTVAGHLGVALRPYFESLSATQQASLAPDVMVTDAQVLDIRRLTDGRVESPSVTARGMLYWYHVLADRIDQNVAWQAALAWQDDDVSTVASASTSCVVARLQVDPAALDVVTSAFQEWAAAAPPTSLTTVVASTDGSAMQLQINACDPGAQAVQATGLAHLALGAAPLRSEQYRLLLVSQPTLAPAQAACAVFGADTVSLADERGVIDSPEGWTTPANHPLPDPNRLGCAPA